MQLKIKFACSILHNHKEIVLNLMKFRYIFRLAAAIIFIYIFQACSTTKFVPDGEYLLQETKIESDTKNISMFDMEPYIKQKANYKTLEIFKLPLFIYDLSGHDSTKWINKMLRSGGEPPVIYDSTMVASTVSQLETVLKNRGYLNAKVTPEIKLSKKKARVIYNIESNKPYTIGEYSINIEDSIFDTSLFSKYKPTIRIIPHTTNRDSLVTHFSKLILKESLIKKGENFDLNALDLERDRIASIIRQAGYFAFNKEYIGFVADTTASNRKVDLALQIYPFMQRTQNNEIVESPHKLYIVDDVKMYVDYNPLESSLKNFQPSDIYEKDSYAIYYGERERFIRPSVLLSSCYIKPKQLYSEKNTTFTYNTFSQLSILTNVNIKYEEFMDNDTTKLRCIITCIPQKKQGVSVELEGTNSASFLGVGTGIGYTHRNLLKGSEVFKIKAQGAYEAITPSFSSFNDNYFEIGGDISLTFPQFMIPFLSKGTRRKIHATTQFNSNYSFQRRPGYFTRTVLSGGVQYSWQNRTNRQIKHTLDLIDLSYVHIPFLDSEFKNKLTENAILYSFTDQFIMSLGYTYSRSNFDASKKIPSLYSFRGSIESAGNLLALAAMLANVPEDEYGSKKIFNTYFAQYIKGNFDYSRTFRLDKKNSFAWRVGGGVAVPYGNYKLIPYQKRFYSGGANSVRGWAVRELGPGAHYSSNSDFYAHSGDIRFDANIEYRSNFFWKFELAAFLDVGNIWTIKEYEKQEKGSFKLNSFYKEIAAAWGLGLRLDFEFVLIRLDCGWKLYNPADTPIYKDDGQGNLVFDRYKSKWDVTKPFKIRENTAWHIAIGYPF